MKTKAAVGFLLLLGLLFLPAYEEDVWNQSYQKIASIITLIEDNYYESVERDELAFSSIRGMLQTLDPHSYFLDPRNFSTLQEEYKGKYFGLGIMIQKQEDRLVVITPIEGTPASRLGIQAGDIISHIEGESTKSISSIEAMQKLRGLKGTEVSITIVRVTIDQPLELTITREEIPLHSVPYSFILQDNIGYIYIRNFAETTTDEFKEKMQMLEGLGMEKLILDLRQNGGGTFVQSIELSEEFLPKGSGIVSIKGRRQYYNREFLAKEDNSFEKIPLIILINQGSASAPEIVSGAIMDNDRGLIIGETSWGKGLVQTVFPLAPDAAVAITTAKYYTPSGRSIQRDYSSLEDYYIYKPEAPEDEREVRYTAGGRKVLGQGGIAPDYEVKFSYKNQTARLLLKGAFFSYVREFANRRTDLAKKVVFPNDPQGHNTNNKLVIAQGFKVNDEVLTDFRSYLSANEIAFESSEFAEARTEIVRELEREIYTFLWGIDEGMRIFRQSDPLILKAITHFPEAEQLLHIEQ